MAKELSHVVERFLRYVKVDTQSVHNCTAIPTTEKQKDLARMLVKELEELGAADIRLDDAGCVYATIPANCDVKAPVVGFIAHMDTTPDASGTNVTPRIIENYDGKDIVLKWPNDIFVDGKKLGGVLAEMVPLAATPIADGATGTTDVAAAPERVGIVFGIGLNLAVPEDHLPTDKATSLQLVAHGLPDSMTLRDMIAAHLVDGLRSRLADFEADPQREATRAMEEMRPVCWTLGKPCEAHFVDGTTLRGTALELNPDASLTIRDDNGNLHTVRTADVGVLPQ